MSKYTVKTDRGTVVLEAPDDATPQEIDDAVQGAFGSSAPSPTAPAIKPAPDAPLTWDRIASMGKDIAGKTVREGVPLLGGAAAGAAAFPFGGPPASALIGAAAYGGLKKAINLSDRGYKGLPFQEDIKETGGLIQEGAINELGGAALAPILKGGRALYGAGKEIYGAVRHPIMETVRGVGRQLMGSPYRSLKAKLTLGTPSVSAKIAEENAQNMAIAKNEIAQAKQVSAGNVRRVGLQSGDAEREGLARLREEATNKAKGFTASEFPMAKELEQEAWRNAKKYGDFIIPTDRTKATLNDLLKTEDVATFPNTERYVVFIKNKLESFAGDLGKNTMAELIAIRKSVGKRLKMSRENGGIDSYSASKIFKAIDDDMNAVTLKASKAPKTQGIVPPTAVGPRETVGEGAEAVNAYRDAIRKSKTRFLAEDVDDVVGASLKDMEGQDFVNFDLATKNLRESRAGEAIKLNSPELHGKLMEGFKFISEEMGKARRQLGREKSDKILGAKQAGRESIPPPYQKKVVPPGSKISYTPLFVLNSALSAAKFLAYKLGRDANALDYYKKNGFDQLVKDAQASVLPAVTQSGKTIVSGAKDIYKRLPHRLPPVSAGFGKTAQRIGTVATGFGTQAYRDAKK